VTAALLRHVRFVFHLVTMLPCWRDFPPSSHGYDVISTDIAESTFASQGVDFLACESVQAGCRSIIVA
jgi:hypothetical protein